MRAFFCLFVCFFFLFFLMDVNREEASLHRLNRFCEEITFVAKCFFSITASLVLYCNDL